MLKNKWTWKYVRLLITQSHGIAPIAFRASLVWTAVQVLIGDRLINSISSHHLFSESRLRVICAWSSSVRAAAFPCTRAIDSCTHTGYRSIIALITLACTRADQSGHHLVMPFRRLFSPNTFSASLIRLWPSHHYDFGGSIHGWRLFIEHIDSLQAQLSQLNSLSFLPHNTLLIMKHKGNTNVCAT